MAAGCTASAAMQDVKYVFLGANSTFKADSDLAKYEKASVQHTAQSKCGVPSCLLALAGAQAQN